MEAERPSKYDGNTQTPCSLATPDRPSCHTPVSVLFFGIPTDQSQRIATFAALGRTPPKRRFKNKPNYCNGSARRNDTIPARRTLLYLKSAAYCAREPEPQRGDRPQPRKRELLRDTALSKRADEPCVALRSPSQSFRIIPGRVGDYRLPCRTCRFSCWNMWLAC